MHPPLGIGKEKKIKRKKKKNASEQKMQEIRGDFYYILFYI